MSEFEYQQNTFIGRYERINVIETLSEILGERFRRYREDFDKTQNYREIGYVPEFPLTLTLEPVNRCNLNCIMCYQQIHEDAYAELSLDVLEKMFAECKGHRLPSMILGLGSEPLVYRHSKELLRMIHRAEIIDLFFATNGVLLNDEIVDLVFATEVARVEISLDAARPETYRAIRGKDLLPQVEANIERLLDAKTVRNSILPIFRLCFVVMEKNIGEHREFFDKWKERVDYIDFQRLIDVSHIDSVEQPPPDADLSGAYCSNPFYSLNVWANGDITPCCSFYGRKMVYGNIYKNSLQEVWQGEKIQKLRDELKTGAYNTVCKKCLYYRDRETFDQAVADNQGEEEK